MGEIAMLLFDFYTQQADSQAVRISPPHPQFQRLKQLVGEEAAIEIWDAATGEAAQWEDMSFQAGVQAGIQLAKEFFLA